MPPDISRVEALPPTPRDGPGRRASGGGLGQRRPEGRAWSEGTGARSQAEGLPGPRAAPSRLRTRGSSEPARTRGRGHCPAKPCSPHRPGLHGHPTPASVDGAHGLRDEGCGATPAGGPPHDAGLPSAPTRSASRRSSKGPWLRLRLGPGPAPWLLCASVSPAVKRERKWL